MKDRIAEIMKSEEINAATFADAIGVQRSNISHLLKGRNKPSYDLIQKILLKYKDLNPEWLVLGTGEMYKEQKQSPRTLFNNHSEKKEPEIKEEKTEEAPSPEPQKPPVEEKAPENPVPPSNPDPPPQTFFDASGKVVSRIVVFYTDKTFSVYTPAD